MVYKSFESLSLIAAVKLPKILELLPSSLPTEGAL